MEQKYIKVVSSAIISFSLFLLLASTTKAQSKGVFDVTKYGADKDITEALTNAWKDACASTNPSKVLVPSGTYSLRKLILAGPCKAAIELQVDGILKAPVDPNQFSGGHWVNFRYVDKFALSGRGAFDGQGKVAWSKSTFKVVSSAIISFSLFLLLASTTKAQSKGVFDVTKYGADKDITEALTNAWKDACASTNPSKVLVPSGTYSLRKLILAGPCKAAIELQVDGILKAPVDPNQFSGGHWVNFRYVDKFTLSGRGAFDGQGKVAWSKSTFKVVSSAIISFSLFLLLASTTKAQSKGVFDVTKYGADKDITEALTNAWKDACASTNPSKVLVPSGTYSLRKLILAGPCKAAIELQVDGILKAPVDPNQFSGGHWVNFRYVDKFTLSGRGAFDGQGKVAWSKSTFKVVSSAIISFSLFLLLASTTKAQSKGVFDVTKYGADKDITEALTNAWKDACASTNPSKVLVPSGTYSLRKLILAGPCKAAIELQVDGILKAPVDPNQFSGGHWVNFRYVDKFTLSGRGAFDGQGKVAWSKSTFKVVSSAIISFSLFLLLASTTKAQSKGVFDVTKYGADKDITEALTNAWKDACASTNPSKVLVPSGTYSLRKLILAGPCKAAIELQVDGILKAPVDPNQFSGGHWVNFRYVDKFTLSGRGAFDGQGKVAWSKSTFKVVSSAIISFSLFLLLASTTKAQSKGVFDVTKYGADKDITEALTNAWKDACASTNPSKVLVPSGTYSLRKLILAGPCKAAIELQVDGILKAPVDPNQFSGGHWVNFRYVDKFTLSGRGAFDGQGKVAWSKSTSKLYPQQ